MNAPTQQEATGPELESVLRAARDAASEDIVARLSESASRAIELLDRVGRSGVADALPAIAEMVRTGDLERIARYARVLGAAEDAVTEDMIGRFASLAGDATLMVDRLQSSGMAELVVLLGRMNESGALERIAAKLPALLDGLERIESLLACIAEAADEVKAAPAPRGGLLPLLALLRDPENQKALQFFLAASRRLRASGVQPR